MIDTIYAMYCDLADAHLLESGDVGDAYGMAADCSETSLWRVHNSDNLLKESIENWLLKTGPYSPADLIGGWWLTRRSFLMYKAYQNQVRIYDDRGDYGVYEWTLMPDWYDSLPSDLLVTVLGSTPHEIYAPLVEGDTLFAIAYRAKDGLDHA